MSSGADASDRDAALALLSGPDLVAVTCRRADYEAAARVLGDRDRRLAQTKAELAEARIGLADLTAKVEALEECYYLQLKADNSHSSGGAIMAAAPGCNRRTEEPALKGAIDDLCSSSDGDDDELEEGEFRPCVAGVSCKREAPASACSADDEDDKIPLSWLIKKWRRVGPPRKGHGDVQVNSAGPLGVDRLVTSPVNRGIPEAVVEHMVGTPDDPKAAVFMKGTGNGQSGKNGGLSRTMPSPAPTGSTTGNSQHKNCSKDYGFEG